MMTIGIKYSNNLVSIMVGGQNRHYKFSKQIITELIEKIKN